jgi:hypothetical protein
VGRFRGVVSWGGLVGRFRGVVSWGGFVGCGWGLFRGSQTFQFCHWIKKLEIGVSQERYFFFHDL